MSITNEGVEIPDEIMLGMVRGKWPITLLYTDQQAADFLASEANPDERGKRRVYRVKLTPTHEVHYVPPVPPSTEEREIRLARS